ncbi:unnamed protein product [Brassica rapa]|uniref:Uncharacterized protein n=1 Tax=Brassica campestris TaxID=3711 RepID=A0A8D9LQJ4_BRACM|nr:unnamed protein product [Brassica rapa]
MAGIINKIGDALHIGGGHKEDEHKKEEHKKHADEHKSGEHKEGKKVRKTINAAVVCSCPFTLDREGGVDEKRRVHLKINLMYRNLH